MSRTKRRRPNFVTLPSNYERTWIALSRLGFSTWEYEHDPRDENLNGYDGAGFTYYSNGYQKCGCHDNILRGNTRKFYKRLRSKQMRRALKTVEPE